MLQLAPLILFFAATVGAGIVHAALQALFLAGPPRIAATEAMAPLYAFGELVMRSDLGASIVHTLLVAGSSALLANVLGALGAYWVWRSSAPGWAQPFTALYRLPIILPHIVVAFLTVLFWAQTGVIASVLVRIGVISAATDFPLLVFAPNGIGMVLAYTYKGFPFVMLLALGVLQRVPDRMIVTARMLGAGRVRIFFRVVLPILLPILNQLFIILFLFATGGFDIPWILGASQPQMLSMHVYTLYFQGSLADRAVAMAALISLSMLSLAFVTVYARIARHLSAWERPV